MGEVRGVSDVICQSREGARYKIENNVKSCNQSHSFRQIFPMTDCFDFDRFFSFFPLHGFLVERSLCCILFFSLKILLSPCPGPDTQVWESSEQNECGPCCPGAHTLNVWLLLGLVTAASPASTLPSTQEALRVRSGK